ncbi:hypothetical protein [Vibrio coralliilyticus]|uniref:hypothetical protein n=1 Tax=Vibrio coralliilyticus TaxID=190893 RepID=UPI0003692342|nr:hypothetical protein [Vibrio coralliilyticus]
MATLGNCYIGTTKLTQKSKRAVAEIRGIMESGSWFSAALASVPVYQIFFSPGVTKSAFETGINIREYDWEQYANSMGAAPKVVRDRIRKTAEPMTWYTSGNENKFWRCVSEAAL